jgi:hypothetical protein
MARAATQRLAKCRVHAKAAPQACCSPKLLDSLTESNKLLETVQKGLADYLETKRLAFSRLAGVGRCPVCPAERSDGIAFAGLQNLLPASVHLLPARFFFLSNDELLQVRGGGGAGEGSTDEACTLGPLNSSSISGATNPLVLPQTSPPPTNNTDPQSGAQPACRAAPSAQVLRGHCQPGVRTAACAAHQRNDQRRGGAGERV